MSSSLLRSPPDRAADRAVAPRVRRRAATLVLAGVLGVALAAVLLVRGARSAQAPPPAIRLAPGLAPLAHYGTLVRDYRFTGRALPADWSVGTGSHGFQATSFQASQVSMTGSAVALRAAGPAAPGQRYRGGWITTAGRYSLTHGLIDFRARMPAGRGLWSGLWALGGPGPSAPGEIDVQEMLLANTHIVYGSLHDWSAAPWEVVRQTRLRVAASGGFHDYQLVWQPGMITWAIDGVAYAQYTRAEALAAGRSWPFDSGRAVYLIADLAVGSRSEWGGAPSRRTVLPAALELQSIRIWQ